MDHLSLITHDLGVTGGRPCIRGMTVTASTLVGLLATGHSIDDVLALYPYLEREDVLSALYYAAWRAQEIDVRHRAT